MADIVNWLVRSGPLWARIPAVAAVLFVFVVPSVLLVWRPSPQRWLKVAQQAETSQLQMAASAAAIAHQAELNALLDKVNLTAADRSKLKDETGNINHQLQHLTNPKDEGPWKIFAKTSSDDYFGFKLLPSDQCLLLARVERGQADTQWLRDPARITGSTNANPSAAFQIERKGAAETPGTATLLMSVASVRWLERLHPRSVADPAQASCLYPHPGTPRETWEAKIDQCQQPVTRVYGEGCTYVQIYDHCTNTWGPVVWQFCASSHHP